MTALEAFSPDYFTARDRFRTSLARHGWKHEIHPISADGFKDGDLTVDVARVGDPNADRLLIISSGVHGPEGFFGSAVQLAWLDSLQAHWNPPPGCAVLLIHSLNPYGFAKIRRANETNVDLNRNFLPEDKFATLRERTAREYGPLDPYLNPPKAPGAINYFPIVFPWMALRFGLKVLHQVMPAGQYAFPKGIFYGGERQASSTRLVMNQMPRWLGDARFVLHLDYHTGLGKYGTHRLLASEPPGSAQVQEAVRMFGQDRVSVDWETEGGYHNHGDFGEWLARRFSDRRYIYLCAEFGTYGTTRVIGSLRRENQAHQWGDPASRRFQKIKSWVLDTFCPFSPNWRHPVIKESLTLNQKALDLCSKLSS